MLRCVWQALNPLSIHVTFTAIVPGPGGVLRPQHTNIISAQASGRPICHVWLSHLLMTFSSFLWGTLFPLFRYYLENDVPQKILGVTAPLDCTVCCFFVCFLFDLRIGFCMLVSFSAYLFIVYRPISGCRSRRWRLLVLINIQWHSSVSHHSIYTHSGPHANIRWTFLACFSDFRNVDLWLWNR